MDYSEIVFRGG